jgi:hypothetical protein
MLLAVGAALKRFLIRSTPVAFGHWNPQIVETGFPPIKTIPAIARPLIPMPASSD